MLLSPRTVKVILCGARGSGKSTELVRLSRELESDYCVIYTDLAAGLPDEASTLAVVTLLGLAALHATQQWKQPDSEALVPATDSKGGKELLDAALKRFSEAIPPVAELIKGVAGVVKLFAPGTGAALGAGAAVATSASGASSRLRNALVRGPLGVRLATDKLDDAQAVVEAVNQIFAELSELSGRPPLMLADGLDKRTSVEDVERALNDERLLRDLDVPLVLTGPVNLRHDPRFRAMPGNFRASLLYNVPVFKQRDDTTLAPTLEGSGIATLVELYERRRKHAGLPQELIATKLVERAAEFSSGIVRDFLELLYQACLKALGAGRKQVEAEDLDAAIKDLRLRLEGHLDQASIDTLWRVLDKRTLPATPEADTLLFENFIACYPNGDLWYRPHELIVAFVRDHSSAR